MSANMAARVTAKTAVDAFTMTKKLASYVRTHRRRWALTQDELAGLLGYETSAIISALERNVREPSLRAAHSLSLIFDVSPAELFPHLHLTTENEVLQRARDLYDRLQGNTSRAVKLKLDFLEDVFARADARPESAT